MKKIILVTYYLVIIWLGAHTTSQAQISNSGPDNKCGTASGYLSVNPNTTGPIAGWEVGTWVMGYYQMETFYPTSSSSFNYTQSGNKERSYRVRLATNPVSHVGYRTIITYSPTTPGTLTGNATYLESGSGVIKLTGNSGGTVSFGTNSGLTSTGNGNYSYSLTETRHYEATVKNGLCSSTSNTVTILVYKKGVVIAPSTSVIGNRVTVSLSNYYGGIIGWEYSIDGGSTWTFVEHPFYSYRHEITTDTKFRAKVSLGPFGEAYTDPATIVAQEYSVAYPNPIFLYGDSVGNYVKETIVTMAGVNNTSAVTSLTSSSKIEKTTFIDGLGRPAQFKWKHATPDQALPNRKDIVGVIDYDRVGRTPKEYLPYVENGTKFYFRSNYLDEQSSFYTSSENDKVANSTCAYTQSEFENSPLSKVTNRFQPGNCGVSSTVTYTTNDANEVRMFQSSGTSTGFYPVNQLLKIEFTDEDGKKRQTLTNKSGQTILTRVQLNETVGGIFIPWLETYYIYYDNGSIRYQISPKGVQLLKTSSWAFTQTIKNQYVHEFVYDERGRLIEKKVPGQAWMYYCYDPLDRLVLVQDGNLRPEHKWFYIKYDRKGRVVEQGLFTVTNTTQTSRTAVQGAYVNSFYNGGGNPFAGMPGATFPTDNTEVLVTNYYDGAGPSASYTPQGLPGEGTEGTKLGKLTCSYRKILGTGTDLISYYMYDRDGRLIQVKNNNHLSPTQQLDLTTIVYNFAGNVTYKKVFKDTGGGNTITVLNQYSYDHMGRLVYVYQKNNDDPQQFVAHYEYNRLGQLVDKKIHHTSGSNFLQSVDYRYTIQGQLASINNAQLNVNAGNNDETNDYFGMEFLYNTVESGLNNIAYDNGSLSAVKWKGVGSASGIEDQKSYQYTYDNTGRLQTSAYRMRTTGSTWNKEADVFNENTTYDLNGNILTLQRNQRQHQLNNDLSVSYISETIDNLTYTHSSTMGDQLVKVEDASNNPAGFKNGTNQATEYVYNSSGSITQDKNKGISSIVYNLIGKPSVINFTDGHKVEYTYDVSGTKLTMKTYQGTTLQSTTDYLDGFVYENGSLSFFGSPEGRVVKNSSGDMEYQYAISDHQGNTRVVFSSVNPSKITTATFEGNSTDHSSEFQNVNASNVVTFIGANYTQSGIKVIRMNQSYKIGPSRSLNVFPGDKVDLEVWEYHEGTSGFGSSSTPLSTLITMVSGAFGGVSGGAGESGMIFNGVSSAINVFVPGGNQGSTRPAAYLNYILFDKNYKVLDMGWEVAPATTFTKQKLSFNTIEIKEPGYLFVYLSYDNASNNWVYFDDMKITHTMTNVIQHNEYYPFGLQTNTSWTREDSKNDFLYNAGSELNRSSGWYETFHRTYDPALGRFTGIDPLASNFASFSGYHYSFNNPVMFNDPQGAAPYGVTCTGPWCESSIEQEAAGRAAGEGSMRYGADGLTNQQWMNASRPDSDPGLALAYNRQNYHYESRLLYNARKGDTNAALQYAQNNGDLYTVTGYHYAYSADAKGNFIPGTFTFNGFDYEAQQGGKISITKSSDQAVIDQYVRAMYDAQARNSSTINMAEYFTEYTLSKKERNTTFAWSSYGRKVQGELRLRDGGQPLNVFLIFNLDEDWSIMPLKPNSPHQNSGTDSKGFFFFYNYYFEGTPNYNALIFKAYLPNKAADDRFHGFIWNRK